MKIVCRRPTFYCENFCLDFRVGTLTHLMYKNTNLKYYLSIFKKIVYQVITLYMYNTGEHGAVQEVPRSLRCSGGLVRARGPDASTNDPSYNLQFRPSSFPKLPSGEQRKITLVVVLCTYPAYGNNATIFYLNKAFLSVIFIGFLIILGTGSPLD